MKNRFRAAVRLAFTAIIAMIATSGALLSANSNSTNWKVSFQLLAGKARDMMPVQVTAFDIVNHQGGMWVREWRLKNLSSKTVVKLRPALFVVDRLETDKVLVRREVRRSVGLTLAPNTDWPTSVCLPQMKSCEAAFATFSLEELMQPLREQRKENESYSVSLAIDKVWFEDGTTWEFDNE